MWATMSRSTNLPALAATGVFALPLRGMSGPTARRIARPETGVLSVILIRMGSLASDARTGTKAIWSLPNVAPSKR